MDTSRTQNPDSPGEIVLFGATAHYMTADLDEGPIRAWASTSTAC